MGKMDISEVDMDEIYQVSISTAMAFGLSKEQCPKNWEEFEEYYWFWMMNSDHIVVSNDCSRWCKVFFMCNNWYRKATNYGLACYTAMIFPKTVHNKFSDFDSDLLPNGKMQYLYGLFWLGLSRGVYHLLPKSVRQLNHFMDMKQRVHGTHYYNSFQRFAKFCSAIVANHIVHSFIQG